MNNSEHFPSTESKIIQLESEIKTRKSAPMMSINSLFQRHKAECPDSEISLHFIRRAVVSGMIPSVRAGKKYLVNYNSFCDFLSNPPAAEASASKPTTSQPTSYVAVRGIRQIY